MITMEKKTDITVLLVRSSTWFYQNKDTNNFVIVTDTNTGCFMKI